MRKTTSIEFGVVSAECRVQSAGSLRGGGLPKLAMSGCGGGSCASLRACDAESAVTERRFPASCSNNSRVEGTGQAGR